MKSLAYKIIYNSKINPALLKGVKLYNTILNKNLMLPPSGIFSFDLPGGKKVLFETNQTSYLTNVIYWKGVSSFEYTDIFIDLMNNISSYFDIGSNFGYYSIIANKVNPNSTIYAFEPAFGPLHYLKRNIELNKCGDKVKFYDFAFSDSNSEIEFFEQRNPKYPYLKYNLGGMSGANPKFDHAKFEATKIPTTTIDNFVREKNISGLELIKIDTEGTEDKILGQAKQTIEKNRPIIICETLFNKIESPLEKVMKAHGYHFYNFKDKKLSKTNTIVRDFDNGVRDCFFVPPEKSHLIQKYL